MIWNVAKLQLLQAIATQLFKAGVIDRLAYWDLGRATDRAIKRLSALQRRVDRGDFARRPRA